jgi:hypothetical protein
LDWGQMKELFDKKNKELPEKQKIIYFKGTPTTKKIHRLREILQKYAQNKQHMTVLLDGWQNYEPITNFSKYLFLLNLPGHYPWSNRFKYLFLTNSVIINVNVYTKAINDEGWNEDEYHSFMDLVMEPSKDYFDIKFTYFNAGISKSQQQQDKARRMTEQEIDRVIAKIEAIYEGYINGKPKYDAMVASYKKKIGALTNEAIYEYIYKCIVLNATIVVG